jgi:ankyrin repeat protein
MSISLDKLREEAREADEEDWFPIHGACWHVYPARAVERLQLAYPAGVNAVSLYGVTSLMQAVMSKDAEFVDLMCMMGACIGITNDIGESVFYYISFYISEGNRGEFYEVLKKHGVEHNVNSGTIARIKLISRMYSNSFVPIVIASLMFSVSKMYSMPERNKCNSKELTKVRIEQQGHHSNHNTLTFIFIV